MNQVDLILTNAIVATMNANADLFQRGAVAIQGDHILAVGAADEIAWTPERLQNGVIVKLKEVPFKVRLFKLVATDSDIDWVITNCPDETLTAQAAQDANDVRWQIEEFHRGFKQLTGSEKCQCRTARSQRNHLACCYHAWLSLKVKATQLDKTLYQVKTDLFRDYLRAELQNPHIHAFQPA